MSIVSKFFIGLQERPIVFFHLVCSEEGNINAASQYIMPFFEGY